MADKDKEKKESHTFDETRAVEEDADSKTKAQKKFRITKERLIEDESSKIDLPDSTIRVKRKTDIAGQFDVKLEDLRKQVFNETNRLELLLEQGQNQRQKQFEVVNQQMKSDN